MAAAFQALKRIFRAFAPPGSRRRHVLRSLRGLVGLKPADVPPPFAAAQRGRRPVQPAGRQPHPLADGAPVAPLPTFPRRWGRVGWGPGQGETEAARWVLAALMAPRPPPSPSHRPARRPRRRFLPGTVARCSAGSAAAGDVRAAFARGLEKRPRQRYFVFPEYRQACPLGLTPAGRAELLIHLLAKAAEHIPLSDEEILWFHLHNAEDAHHGLTDTYLLTPAWQQRFPDGLTSFGWDRLRAWVRKEYAIVGGWLDGLPVPRTHDAVEAACLHRIALGHGLQTMPQRGAPAPTLPSPGVGGGLGGGPSAPTSSPISAIRPA